MTALGILLLTVEERLVTEFSCCFVREVKGVLRGWGEVRGTGLVHVRMASDSSEKRL